MGVNGNWTRTPAKKGTVSKNHSGAKLPVQLGMEWTSTSLTVHWNCVERTKAKIDVRDPELCIRLANIVVVSPAHLQYRSRLDLCKL